MRYYEEELETLIKAGAKVVEMGLLIMLPKI